MKPRILLSNLLRAAVADAQQLVAQGVEIDLGSWLYTGDCKKICSVCLGGAWLVRKMPDVLQHCVIGERGGFGSLSPQFIYAENFEVHGVLPTVQDGHLWREMLAIDSIRLGRHVSAFRRYYGDNYNGLQLESCGAEFIGSGEEFDAMCESLLATADAIAAEEKRLGIVIGSTYEVIETEPNRSILPDTIDEDDGDRVLWIRAVEAKGIDTFLAKHGIDGYEIRRLDINPSKEEGLDFDLTEGGEQV